MNLFCFIYIMLDLLYNITVNRSEAEGGLVVAKTVVRKNESLDDALRRFKREVSKVGTLTEARKREYYVKPSIKRKQKSEAARKTANKRNKY